MIKNKADDQSKLISEINAGRTAHIVWGHTKPILEKGIARVLVQMKMHFRSGEFSHDKALTCVAQLVVLDDLAAEIEKQILQGENAARKLEPTDN